MIDGGEGVKVWCGELARKEFLCLPPGQHPDQLTLWARDQLYFAVWVTGLAGRRIRWRGRELRVGAKATVQAA